MKRSLLAVTLMLMMVVAASADTVTGTVTDSTGAFVEGAVVSVRVDRDLCPGGQAFRTLTAADGSFTIEEVPEGLWPIHAGKRQVGQVQAEVDVAAEGVATINLQLPGCDGDGGGFGERRRRWNRFRHIVGGR
ncbi:carboxypeptidase-like regulatory domain-containing protein [bacterium]|nr:carboxypeptidase-like regulatory domain-containing protein [bacterium]